MVRFAEYKEHCGKVLKDGHTMFISDIVSDLNRKSYLEEKILQSAPPTNSDYAKCADEVLKIINFSRDSSHGRRIINCIKRHFA